LASAPTRERTGPRRPAPPGETPAPPPRPRVQPSRRLTIAGAVALTAFAILFLRLWALQVISGPQYLRTAQDNQLRTLQLEAPRGPVLDRNGNVLVTNVAGNAVEIWPADLPKTWPEARDELRRLAKVVDMPSQQIWKLISEHKGDPLTPVLVRRSIRPDQYAYLLEHQDEFPGVHVAQHYVRSYPYQSLLAQVLGHVGQASAAQLRQLKREGYKLGDEIGQSGVEGAYDTYLRGRDGIATLRVDARGRPKSGLEPQLAPEPGNALRLTIDIGLQRAAERALRYGIELAHEDKRWNADGGAIVALDPSDGAILALASNPTFKPSIYTGRPSRKKLAPLLEDAAAKKDNYPGLDRAIAGTYPPGSVFKPVTAIAAMQAHQLEPWALLPCTPDYTSHKQTFANWTDAYDRGMNLVEALATSCDTYFYRLGERIFELKKSAGHPLQDWAAKFGIGSATGIDIVGEAPGLLPTPEWRRKTYKTAIDRLWKPGDSIQLAIGQKDITVTPLQMARVYAAIANGGKLVTPHLAMDVEQPGSASDPDGEAGPKVLRSFGAKPARSTGVDPDALKVVRQGLFAATHSPEGTGYGVFGHYPIPIAGKTGTADKIVPLPGYPPGHTEAQAWWCGYGPYGKPELVVCALIENGGHGGVAAAPAALKVFEQFFHKTAGTPIVPHMSD
jgi:penicillin-binding protein 2